MNKQKEKEIKINQKQVNGMSAYALQLPRIINKYFVLEQKQ